GHGDAVAVAPQPGIAGRRGREVAQRRGRDVREVEWAAAVASPSRRLRRSAADRALKAIHDVTAPQCANGRWADPDRSGRVCRALWRLEGVHPLGGARATNATA